MARSLTQTQRDLNKYTQEKAHNMILDVVQAFDIAGEPKSDALACIGSAYLRMAATMAAHCNADRERWLHMCDEVFELAQDEKENNP